MCDKVGYTTYREAAQVKNNFRRRKLQKHCCRDKIPRRAYKCDECGMWHLTSRR